MFLLLPANPSPRTVSENLWGLQELEVMEDGWYLRDAPENSLPKLLLWESDYFLWKFSSLVAADSILYHELSWACFLSFHSQACWCPVHMFASKQRLMADNLQGHIFVRLWTLRPFCEIRWGRLLWPLLCGSEVKWKLFSHVRLFATSRTRGILQARILEWVAFAFSRGSSPTQELNPGLPRCRRILMWRRKQRAQSSRDQPELSQVASGRTGILTGISSSRYVPPFFSLSAESCTMCWGFRNDGDMLSPN